MESVDDFRRMTKLRECVFGLVGDGFAIAAADASTGYNFTGDNTTEDKITVLDSHKLVAAVGFPADRHKIMHSIEDNWDGITWTTESTANFIRTELNNALNNGEEISLLARSKCCILVFLYEGQRAIFLRCQSIAYVLHEVKRLSMLVAGYDEVEGPSLYHIDGNASMKKVEKGAFDGNGCYYNLRMVNNRYNRRMSLEDAICLVNDCMAELKSRRVMKSPYYGVKIVDKDGVRVHIPVENCVIRSSS
ncbi:hypothetical protein DM860_018261 [Cuscuta australis]|uniref:Proteasome subunit beta n=1 Tax=Cuscuta australis TaxID=267555 RepID=A0A328DBE7_9ASTE|nr:hypothetical protein DM860_008726 [Cuscuta australis]RAL41631.1 hypothetical protein DM860_018261 [Cuscuta australis]